MLIDSGATHNFIDKDLVPKRRLMVEDFSRFKMIIAEDFTIPCIEVIRQLKISLGDYIECDDF